MDWDTEFWDLQWDEIYWTVFNIHLSEWASKVMLLFMTDIVMAVTISSGIWLTNGYVANRTEHTPV